MIYIHTSLLKIDTQDHINRIQDLEKETQDLRKDMEVLNAWHIDYLQDKEKEIQDLRKEIEVLNARIKCHPDQLTVTAGRR